MILDLADIEKHDDIVAKAVKCFGVVSVVLQSIFFHNIIICFATIGYLLLVHELNLDDLALR